MAGFFDIDMMEAWQSLSCIKNFDIIYPESRIHEEQKNQEIQKDKNKSL